MIDAETGDSSVLRETKVFFRPKRFGFHFHVSQSMPRLCLKGLILAISKGLLLSNVLRESCSILFCDIF